MLCLHVSKMMERVVGGRGIVGELRNVQFSNLVHVLHSVFFGSDGKDFSRLIE